MEDEEQDFKYFKAFFASALEGIAEIDFEYAKTPEEACEKLSGNAAAYQLFVADLLFPDPTDKKKLVNSGMMAVRVAAQHPQVTIIGISGAETQIAQVETVFKNFGGSNSHFIDKRVLRDPRDRDEHRRIERELIEFLDSRRLITLPHASLDWTPGTNDDLDSVIEEIGKPSLVELLDKLAPGHSKFVPTYVSSGFSGAVILRAKGFEAGKNHPSSEILLKCATNYAKLEREWRRAPKPLAPGQEVYVPYVDSPPVSTRDRGWFAISARFREDAMEMRDWLSITTPDQIPPLLEELFGGLQHEYRNATAISCTAIEILRKQGIKCAQILRKLPLLINLIEVSQPGSRIDLSLIRNFIKFGHIGRRPEGSVRAGSFRCLCHGDLHTRNVLVTTGGRPRPLLIDPANRDQLHWATDVARLVRDLLLSVWDGDQESYFWTKLPYWRTSVRAWMSGGTVPSDRAQRNVNAWTALRWIRDKIPDIFTNPIVPEAWEFEVALALECLQVATYDDIPAPKRGLALMIASDLIVGLEPRLPNAS